MNDFDTWMLKQAREKPKSPIYAHLQARAAIEAGEGVESQGNAVSVRSIPLPVVVDSKSLAAGEEREEMHRESREEEEIPGIPEDWDASEPIEEE